MVGVANVINHGSYYTTKCGILGTLRTYTGTEESQETTEFKLMKQNNS